MVHVLGLFFIPESPRWLVSPIQYLLERVFYFYFLFYFLIFNFLK